MTQKQFTIIFLLISVSLLLVLNEFGLLDYIATYSFIVILIAYQAGQYSTKFPKEK